MWRRAARARSTFPTALVAPVVAAAAASGAEVPRFPRRANCCAGGPQAANVAARCLLLAGCFVDSVLVWLACGVCVWRCVASVAFVRVRLAHAAAAAARGVALR